MKQEQIFEATRKAIEKPLEFTGSVIKETEKLTQPTPEINRLGTTIGSCVGVGLLVTGAIQTIMGRPLWAIGTVTAGTVTIVSNIITRRRREK